MSRSQRPGGTVALTLLAIVAAAETSTGQCGEGWIPGDGVLGVRGRPYVATLWDPDGDGPRESLVIVAGDISIAGQIPVRNIAAWDGERWTPLGGGFDGVVTALAVYNGEIVAGGRFSVAGTTPAANLARWDGVE